MEQRDRLGLQETAPGEDEIGGRSLTHWGTAGGRWLVGRMVALARVVTAHGVLALTASATVAQVLYGSIVGVVKDPQGGNVPGATVTVVNKDTEPGKLTVARVPVFNADGEPCTYFDLNTDGVANYGLYADWISDLINQSGSDGPLLRRHLLAGAEAYTVMWEKSRG